MKAFRFLFWCALLAFPGSGLGLTTAWSQSQDELSIQIVLDSATLSARGYEPGALAQVGTCVGTDTVALSGCLDPCTTPTTCDCECKTVTVDAKGRALVTKGTTLGPSTSDIVHPPGPWWLVMFVNGERLSPPMRVGHSMSASVTRRVNGDFVTKNAETFFRTQGDPLSPMVHINTDSAAGVEALLDLWRGGGFPVPLMKSLVDPFPSIRLSAGNAKSALFLRNQPTGRVMQINDSGVVFPDGSIQTTASSGGGGGWTDAGTTVKLTDSTNDVAIGASSASGFKLRVQTTGGGISGILSRGATAGTGQQYRGLQIYHEHTGLGPGSGWGSDITFRSLISGTDRLMAGIEALRDGSNTRSRLEWYAMDGITSRRMVLTADGNVGIATTTPSEKLHVVGNICATGTIGVCSDARLKEHVQPIMGALETIQRLRGVAFDWRGGESPERGFSTQRQLGFIAQDVKEVVPSVVSLGNDGYYSLDYGRLTPLLVEAIKEQQLRIAALEQQVAQLSRLVLQGATPSTDSRMAVAGDNLPVASNGTGGER